MTIEGVMGLADAYARAVHDGADHNCVASMDRLRAALTALVAQARDDALEEVAAVCKQYVADVYDPLDRSKADAVGEIERRIRVRIAGRKE